jgi:hypothetical protein
MSAVDDGEDDTLFFNFLKNRDILKYLQSKEWDKFAKLYNGPRFKENKYDEKLAKAYIKHGGK